MPPKFLDPFSRVHKCLDVACCQNRSSLLVSVVLSSSVLSFLISSDFCRRLIGDSVACFDGDRDGFAAADAQAGDAAAAAGAAERIEEGDEDARSATTDRDGRARRLRRGC